MNQNISRRTLLASGLTAIGGSVVAEAAIAAEGDRTAAHRPLTLESLGTTLAAMGFETKKIESRYDFTFAAKHEEEWNLSMTAALSTDEKSIWIMAWLDELPKSAGDVPRTSLLRLLADNDKIGNGIFFAYVPSVKRFTLQRVLRNDRITSASLRADLTELGAKVIDMYPHWNVANWRQATSTTTAAGRGSADDDDTRSAGSRSNPPPASRSINGRTAGRDATPGETRKR
jgi:hypothetical protein